MSLVLQLGDRTKRHTVSVVGAILIASFLLGILIGTDKMSLFYEQFDVLLSILLVTVLCIGGIRFGRLSRKLDIFEPLVLVCIGHLLYFSLIPALYILRPNEAVLTFFPDTFSYLAKVESFVAVALLAFLLGYQIRIAGPVAKPRFQNSRVQSHRLLIIKIGVLALSIIGVASYLIYFRSVGGLDYILTHSSRRATWLGDLDLVGLGWSFWASQFLLAVPVLLYAYFQMAGRIKQTWVIWIIACFVSLLFLPLGGRLRALTPVALVFIAHHYTKKRVSMGSFAILCILLVPFLFILGWIRGQDLGISVIKSPLILLEDMTFSLIHMLALDYDRVEVIAFILSWFPNSVPFLHGRTFVSALMPFLTRIIPNLSYSDYPSAGIYLGQLIYGKFNIPGGPLPTLFGEMYMNFGYWGALFGFFVTGVFLRLLYAYVQGYLGRSIALSVLYSMFSFLIVYHSFFNGLALFKVAIPFVPSLIIMFPFRWEKTTRDFLAESVRSWPHY